MTVDEALQYADEWAKGQTFYEGMQGWRVVCATLADEVRRLRDIKTCEWTQDCDDSELYETECGHVFQFIDGSPDDNKFKNCPFCGGMLSVSEDVSDER